MYLFGFLRFMMGGLGGDFDGEWGVEDNFFFFFGEFYGLRFFFIVFFL